MPLDKVPSSTLQPVKPRIHVLGLGQAVQETNAFRGQLIHAAEILVAGERIHAAFPEFQGRRITLKAPLAPILDELVQSVDHGLRVVVLVGGDPCFYGIGPLLVRRLGPERVRLHPGTTTVQAAAALLGISLQGVAVVSMHGRDNSALLFAALARNHYVAVYTDQQYTPVSIARMVLERGGDNFRAWVFENLGLTDQRWGTFTLEQVRETEFSSLNLMLFERAQEAEVRLTLGMREQSYIHEQGLITKRLVRAGALAALELESEHVLWDLGAGCGSVGIEAGLLLPGGSVLAVERNQQRIAMIRENVRRTNAFWVQAIHGQMPGCLRDLPAPDRIFIGGGLSTDGPLLDVVQSRLKSGGRLVAAVVLLESLERIKKYLEQIQWPLEIVQIQTSQCVPLAGGNRLHAQSPVFLVSARKPGDTD